MKPESYLVPPVLSRELCGELFNKDLPGEKHWVSSPALSVGKVVKAEQLLLAH